MVTREVASKWLPRKRVRLNRATFTTEKKQIKQEIIDDLQDEATVALPRGDTLTKVKQEIPDLAKDITSDVSNDMERAINSRNFVKIKSEIKNEAHETIKEEIKDLDAVEHHVKAPPKWQTFVQKVREMRALKEAPVDTMGCSKLSTVGIDPKVARFQSLVGLMLSSQTKDEVTHSVVMRLREKLDPTLTPESIRDINEADLAQLLLPVGFFRRKAHYLKQAAEIVIDKYGGDIPSTIPDMVALPGVGPKMAHLLLQVAWHRTEGIGVDVHVHRLAQWWHWVPKTEHPTPEKTRIALEQWLPEDLWAEINPLLVGFGQTWCPPRKSRAKCEECHLNTLCPASEVKPRKSNTKLKNEQ